MNFTEGSVPKTVKIAAVEGGGTAWKVAIKRVGEDVASDEFLEQVEFPTSPDPTVTLGQIREWLNQRDIDAIGVASFGPVDPNMTSPTYGFITSTPKPGWRNTDVLRLLGCYEEFAGIPCLFDTDVNAPALSEYMYRNTPGVDSLAYITIGTGIGVGLVANGSTVKGLLHPEAGHIFVKMAEDEDFRGSCPFHGNCVEGMCSTVGLTARLSCKNEDLPNLSDTHPLWDRTAYYIAQMCANLLLIASPQKIVIGGGVMKRRILYPLVREKFLQLVNGYIQHPAISKEGVEDYITHSIWGDHAGLVGAAFLAHRALEDRAKIMEWKMNKLK